MFSRNTILNFATVLFFAAPIFAQADIESAVQCGDQITENADPLFAERIANDLCSEPKCSHEMGIPENKIKFSRDVCSGKGVVEIGDYNQCMTNCKAATQAILDKCIAINKTSGSVRLESNEYYYIETTGLEGDDYPCSATVNDPRDAPDMFTSDV
ncbi:hypothetical protein CYLTODRAFT_440939 [Cylindrobasidium torrendii FP15055 ss-10]|uniref:Secreted protein n=1 Tax=Cylindrobasidium torrendii FP15055 ss-10 TaxID=1314674 RepID=A0A0D7BQX9_9AGAR|nr:hypothetical protein CYLTODRAFT_440939 [Cylindrobasidium torrendii FP15055 ss-10]